MVSLTVRLPLRDNRIRIARPLAHQGVTAMKIKNVSCAATMFLGSCVARADRIVGNPVAAIFAERLLKRGGLK
jgi:hypothetical protein